LLFDYVKSIQTANVFDDHAITIGGTAADPPVTISLSRVGETVLTSGAPIKSLTAIDWSDENAEADSITAPWIGKVTIKGDKKADPAVRGDFEADIITTDAAFDLVKLTVAGLMSGSSVDIAGNLKSVTVGAIRDSRVFLGFTGDVLPDAKEDLAERTLSSFKVKGLEDLVGPSFVNSSVAAAALNKVKLLDVEVGDGNGEDFGFAAWTVKSFSMQTDNGPFTLKNLIVAGDADPNAGDDFVIRVFGLNV
jgi:hypothetical protein